MDSSLRLFMEEWQEDVLDLGLIFFKPTSSELLHEQELLPAAISGVVRLQQQVDIHDIVQHL